MRYNTFIFLLAGLVSLTGCAKDLRLAPPEENVYVALAVKVPKELKPRVIKLIYRSTLCTFTDHGASGQSYKRDGYQSMDVELVRTERSDLYEAKLPRNGGGACQWRLSNATFGVVYSDPSYFGEEVTYGAGGGVVVMFDDNNSPRGGADIETQGNVIIKKDYYPWLSEAFLGGHRKQISLEGGSYIYLMYKATSAHEIYFEPIFHSKFIVTSIEPKVKKKGSYPTFVYPDGSFTTEPRSEPDYKKLETLRIKSTHKQ